METTRDLIDAIKEKAGISSDYALAAYMGCTRAQISAYRRDKESLSDSKAIWVACQLGKEPGYVMALMQAERAMRAHNESTRAAWERAAEILKHHGAAAALLILAAVPALSPTPANAAPPEAPALLCILCKIRRALDRARSSLATLSRYSAFRAHAALSY